MRGQRAAVGTIKQWTVHTSTKKGFVRVRNFIKVDDTARKLIGHGGWVPLARYNWAAVHGAIPPGAEVIHKRPPPDVQKELLHTMHGPPDLTVDDIANLTLASKGGVVEKVKANRTHTRKHRKRRNVAVVRTNQRRCRVNDALTIKPHRWYPVRVDQRQIVMQSARTCKAARGMFAEGVAAGQVIALRGDQITSTEPYDGFARFVPVIDEDEPEGDCPEDGQSSPLADLDEPAAGDLDAAA